MRVDLTFEMPPGRIASSTSASGASRTASQEIAPPVPAFYAKPQTIEEMIDQTLGRILDLFGLGAGTVRRWGEMPEAGERPLRAKPRRG